jgi:luciferase family oxidoreductase group 1
LNVPLWILGSSLFGAHLAAHLGLPFAFASHFAPAQMEQAIALYRQMFKPSEQLAKPYVMLGVNVFAADTNDEAWLLSSSMQQAFVNLRAGRSGPLPPPVAGYEDTLPGSAVAMLTEALRCSFIGTPDVVRDGLAAFAERTGADELIVSGQIFDHKARLQSFEITAEAVASLS